MDCSNMSGLLQGKRARIFSTDSWLLRIWRTNEYTYEPVFHNVITISVELSVRIGISLTRSQAISNARNTAHRLSHDVFNINVHLRQRRWQYAVRIHRAYLQAIFQYCGVDTNCFERCGAKWPSSVKQVIRLYLYVDISAGIRVVR